jgi:hypothetical protein
MFPARLFFHVRRNDTMRSWAPLDLFRTSFNHWSDSVRPRWRITGLVAVGVAGTIELIVFAFHIEGPRHWGKAAKRGFSSGEIRHSEAKWLWLHPLLHKLASDPPDAKLLQEQEQFEIYAKQNGLDSTFYVLKVSMTLVDGRVQLTTTIRNPAVMPKADFHEFIQVLQAAGGRPSFFEGTQIAVIPPELLRVDRTELLYGLEYLESSGHEKTVK